MVSAERRLVRMRRVIERRWDAVLAEHDADYCESEMGSHVCPGGCPRAFCTSESHLTGDPNWEAPAWPCAALLPILGFESAQAYWDAQDAAWMAWAEQHPEVAG